MRSIWHLLGADTPEEGLHVATANERLEEIVRHLLRRALTLTHGSLRS